MTTTSNPTPRHIAIMSHPFMDQAIKEAQRVQAYLMGKGISAETAMSDDNQMAARIQQGSFDLVIVLGGDGTILRVGHLCSTSSTPILGINFGRFGFLMEIHRGAWIEYLPKLLAGEYRLERRMMLRAEHWRNGSKLDEWEVLNDVVVCRGQLVRPLHLSASVDGQFLTTYVADGLIASTPTGSTAYALAAGGPITPPELRNILLVPVAPHLSVDRAILLAEGSKVSITVQSDHPAVLSVDGQAPVTMEKGDRVDATAGNHTLNFIRFQDAGYFFRELLSHMEQNPSTGRFR